MVAANGITPSQAINGTGRLISPPGSRCVSLDAHLARGLNGQQTGCTGVSVDDHFCGDRRSGPAFGIQKEGRQSFAYDCPLNSSSPAFVTRRGIVGRLSVVTFRDMLKPYLEFSQSNVTAQRRRIRVDAESSALLLRQGVADPADHVSGRKPLALSAAGAGTE